MSRRMLLALVASLVVAAVPARAQSLAITHVTVIDVEHGRHLRDQTVVVSGSRITAVATNARVPAGAERVDGRGQYLIPGLWDMHIHSASEGRAPRFWALSVAYGVTGIRNMGSPLDSILYWRAVRDTMHGVAPRVVWSSPIIDGVESYPWAIVVRTPAEARAVVDSMKRLRMDELKVYGSLTRETFFALADEARRVGLPFSGHVPHRVTPVEAARAGMRSIEHLENEVEYCTPGLMDVNAVIDSSELAGAKVPRELYAKRTSLVMSGYEDRTCDAMQAVFVAKHVWQTPTLVANEATFDMADTLMDRDFRRALVPASQFETWRRERRELLGVLPKGAKDAMGRMWFSRRRLTGSMAAAGVNMLAGTDAAALYGVVPGASVWDELLLLDLAGLTPLQVLQSATINPARYLRATDSLGVVARGMLADLVLLGRDPLRTKWSVQTLRGVVANGHYLSRAGLDSVVAHLPH